jgi:hypothetical protein
MACAGSCTWKFVGDHWILESNGCAGANCNCTGPLPADPPGRPPEHGTDIFGRVFISDRLLRATFPGEAIPAVPAATVGLLPLVGGLIANALGAAPVPTVSLPCQLDP